MSETKVNRELELEVAKSAFFLVDTIETLELEEKRLRANKPKAPLPPAQPIEPKLENEQMAELQEQGNQTLKSVSNWQKADIGIREYRRIQAKRAARR